MSSTSRSRGRPAPARGEGLLSRMSVPPMAGMPPIRTSFVRGLAGTWSSPVVVGTTVAWILVEWIVVVGLGYPGPFALLAHAAAPAPLSTTTDLSVSIGIMGVDLGLPLVLIPAAVHALWQSIVVGLALETIESGSASRWGAVRGLRAFPVALAIHAFGVMILFASQILAGLAGGGFSFILQLLVLVLAVWVFAFAPVIAIAERRRFLDCLGRSFRAARLPGSGNLTFAALYVVPWFAVFVATLVGAVPGSAFDVNPPYSAWIFVVIVSLLHVAIQAALGMRYLAIADEVPEAPVRRTPARGGRRSR
jgi:hypothetical protein